MTDHDIRCSNACTRAALSALLAVSITVAMIGPLTKLYAVQAFRQYASLRLELKDRLDSLLNTPCFQRITEENGKDRAFGLRLRRVAAFECKSIETRAPRSATFLREFRNIPNEEIGFTVVERPPRPPDTTRPAAPSSLRVEVEKVTHLNQPNEIAQALRDLLESGVLELAGKHSDRALRSVGRWKKLIAEKLLDNGWTPRSGKDLVGQQVFPWSIWGEDLLDYLEVNDVVELAESELPDLSESETVQGQLRIKLPQVPLPLDLGIATILVEFGLFLSVGYFLLYQRESMQSSTFPAEATFFSVFRRSKLSRWMFYLLSVLPPTASVVLVAYSISTFDRAVNASLAAVISVMSLLIIINAWKIFRLSSTSPSP